jgi:hypothetical protein
MTLWPRLHIYVLQITMCPKISTCSELKCGHPRNINVLELHWKYQLVQNDSVAAPEKSIS